MPVYRVSKRGLTEEARGWDRRAQAEPAQCRGAGPHHERARRVEEVTCVAGRLRQQARYVAIADDPPGGIVDRRAVGLLESGELVEQQLPRTTARHPAGEVVIRRGRVREVGHDRARDVEGIPDDADLLAREVGEQPRRKRRFAHHALWSVCVEGRAGVPLRDDYGDGRAHVPELGVPCAHAGGQ